MIKNGKKIYSGIFRDGGAGAGARRRFRNRRKKLMQKENRLIVLTGVPYGPGEETTWAYAHCPTYQEPTLMYLTGVNQSQVILLLDPGARDSDEILFLRKKDPAKEFWDGIRFGVGDPKSEREVRTVTGIREVRDIEDFDRVFAERLEKRRKKDVGTFWLESAYHGHRRAIKTDHNWKFKQRVEKLARRVNPEIPVTNIQKTHFQLRLPLDALDVANTLQAQKITGRAFIKTLRNFHRFRNECQVQGFLEGRMQMESPYGLSFPAIIASGHNATVLHYLKNDDPFTRNEMVLMDFGVRWMTMHADISRTVPASGKFNPMQKILYEIVLAAQRAVERKARAGVTIVELNQVCWDSVNRGLEKKFKALGGTCCMQYEYRPHGVSHLMGEQEHDGDPFRDYGGEPMRAGWLISNEPGLYGTFKIRIGGRTYEEELGIRIEDNLLITPGGCRNLSRSVPKTVADIERWMAARARDIL